MSAKYASSGHTNNSERLQTLDPIYRSSPGSPPVLTTTSPTSISLSAQEVETTSTIVPRNIQIIIWSYEPAADLCPPPVLVKLEPMPVNNLARIRDILKLTMQDIANMLGVSRQAVYDWKNGHRHPQEHIASRLAELAKVADVFAGASNITVDAHTFRRKINGGRTILEAIFSGSDSTKEAQILLDTLQFEAQQRAHLSIQFHGRTKSEFKVSDYASPFSGDP